MGKKGKIVGLPLFIKKRRVDEVSKWEIEE